MNSLNKQVRHLWQTAGVWRWRWQSGPELHRCESFFVCIIKMFAPSRLFVRSDVTNSWIWGRIKELYKKRRGEWLQYSPVISSRCLNNYSPQTCQHGLFAKTLLELEDPLLQQRFNFLRKRLLHRWCYGEVRTFEEFVNELGSFNNPKRAVNLWTNGELFVLGPVKGPVAFEFLLDTQQKKILESQDSWQHQPSQSTLGWIMLNLWECSQNDLTMVRCFGDDLGIIARFKHHSSPIWISKWVSLRQTSFWMLPLAAMLVQLTTWNLHKVAFQRRNRIDKSWWLQLSLEKLKG